MRSCRFGLVIFYTAILAYVSVAQNVDRPSLLIPPPGNIRLLDGYTHEQHQGKDSRVGIFKRPDGFAFGYDIGATAGNQARQQRPSIQWSETQSINDDTLTITSTPERLFASFDSSSANFIVTPKDLGDLADFLLTIVTYVSKPTSPSETNLKLGPRKIRLLPGYANQPSEGIDSAPGTIRKTDGLSINYDIGRMASNQVENVYKLNPSNVIWKKQQDLNGKKFSMILLKDGRIIANFAEESANFSATPKNGEELTDFLLMILTY